MQVGDIEIDPDGSEWVIIGISFANGQRRPSRLRRNSMAHRVHAESSPTLAASLDKEVDESATTSANSPDPAP